MSKEIKAWKCEKCGVAYMNKITADNCCKEAKVKIPTCRVCGGKVDEYRTICDSCSSKEHYQNGTKIKCSEYELGWLHDNNTDKFFADIDELNDYYLDEGLPLPKWCYGCTEIPFTINIDSALESSSEEMYEDFEYDNDAVDIKELIDFIDKWNKKQTASSYEIDHKKIILLNE
ncbi:hypothetical protein [Clostridium estertheticum]|uniref:hypothetical protein n=1 Tax=Clostridium estertheticum TaxID=238834 RepID=UPI001C0AE5F9|nr:hypothetical protein [Clostridium estertheticum]MBU3186557.1 hypothetical protein [Clostridium estertheticum]